MFNLKPFFYKIIWNYLQQKSDTRIARNQDSSKGKQNCLSSYHEVYLKKKIKNSSHSMVQLLQNGCISITSVSVLEFEVNWRRYVSKGGKVKNSYFPNKAFLEKFFIFICHFFSSKFPLSTWKGLSWS